MKVKKEETPTAKVLFKCDTCGARFVERIPILNGSIVLHERRCLCSQFLHVMHREVIGLGALVREK